MLNLIPRNTILILLYIVLFIIIFSFFTFYMSIRPGKWPAHFTPEILDLEYENVAFKSSDGLKLKGWFLPGKGNNTIIVMHGYPTNKADVLPFSMFLLEKFNVFLFDFRSFGESEGKYTTAGFKEVNDLDGAVSYLKTREDTGNIGALGFSLGGAVAIMNKNENIDAIVSDSAYSNLNNMIESMYRNFYFLKPPFVLLTRIYSKLFFGIDIKDVSPATDIKKKNKSIFIIHGKKDRQIDANEAQILYNANKKTELWIVENAGHGQTYALNKEEYENRVLGFFEKNLS
ncbi:MAG: alpha/beta hydrolase [Candidatus Woesearchaeota archaeon]|nr:alpha/beta hydrolase [Candidatus Woesearchaeota archaeon]